MFIVISGNVRRIWYLAELLSTPYSHLFTRSLLCAYMHTLQCYFSANIRSNWFMFLVKLKVERVRLIQLILVSDLLKFLFTCRKRTPSWTTMCHAFWLYLSTCVRVMERCLLTLVRLWLFHVLPFYVWNILLLICEEYRLVINNI